MKPARSKGFTLIELLTVIAIIAILAGITFAALPRVLEKAKVRRMVASMNDLRTAMTTYYTDHVSYPPGYGFVSWDMRNQSPAASPVHIYYYLDPYLAYLGRHGVEAYNDEFSDGYDGNRDGSIGIAEFMPVGVIDPVSNRYYFPRARYAGANIFVNHAPGTDNEGALGRISDAEYRPFYYIPVHVKQFEKARLYWVETGNYYAETWDPNHPRLQTITFPPPRYDAFALVSVGPGFNTFGVIPEPLGSEPARDLYHITALRAFFLATRDLNNNGELDFHFESRRTGEAALQYSVRGNPVSNKLPPPPASNPQAYGRNGYGPYIYVYGYPS